MKMKKAPESSKDNYIEWLIEQLASDGANIRISIVDKKLTAAHRAIARLIYTADRVDPQHAIIWDATLLLHIGSSDSNYNNYIQVCKDNDINALTENEAIPLRAFDVLMYENEDNEYVRMAKQAIGSPVSHFTFKHMLNKYLPWKV